MKSLFVHTALISLAWVSIAFPIAAYADDDGLVAHWKLTADASDGSGNGHHAINHLADGLAPNWQSRGWRIWNTDPRP